MAALDLLRSWPAPTAAAAVIRAEGVVAATGPCDHRFALSSVTKPLFALACLVAIEEGTLGLDEPAGPPGATVRHLLAHASGLGFDEVNSVADPGARRVYSNVGFDVLGWTLEGNGGIPATTYFTEAVCQPLGLRATSIDGSPAKDGTSTVDDLCVVAGELLAPATLVAGATLREATTPQFPELAGVVPGFGRQDPNPWGLGFEIRGGKDPHWTGRHNSARTFGHFGRCGTFLWVDPAVGLACVALTDLEFGRWAIDLWPAFSDAVLDEFAA